MAGIKLRTFWKQMLLVGVGAMLALAAPASAEVQPGNVPADSIANAYPISSGITYNGAFQPDQFDSVTGQQTYHDVDYLAFTVPTAGDTLEFTLQNTTQTADPNAYEWCPVYLSILDGTDNQVGGPSSGAGTIATWGDTEIFNWTFSAPGTYYLVMESNGDMPAGDPTYAVSFRPAPPPPTPGGTGGTGATGSGGTKTHPGGSGGHTGTGTGSGATSGSGFSGPLGSSTASGALVRLLRVGPSQTGTAVKGALTLGQWAKSVRVSLLTAKSLKTIVTLARAPVGPGLHHYKLVLPAAYQRMLKARHKLLLVVRIVVRGASGQSVTFNRRVTLRS